MSDTIKFQVNGVEHAVSSEISSDVMLVDYIREILELRGTKYMCREGGCGACIVNASTSPGAAPKAVNSCLVAVTSCQDWKITTIEGLGNRHKGYHKLQTTLAEDNGTQCGYCSSGWIMSMNGLLESTNDVTMLDVEKAFGSNLCRCTGYRPIIECFKKFAKDAPKEHRITDIENLSICNKKGKICKKNSCTEDDWCMVQNYDVLDKKIKHIKLKDGRMWYKPTTLAQVFDVLKKNSSGSDYILSAGNTAKGVTPLTNGYPPLIIDISQLKELKITDYDQNLIIGAGVTLTEFLDILKTESTKQYFSYLAKLYDHMLAVAHIPIRNIGTIAGNLMIKHAHKGFQSDVYLILETVGAQITIMDWNFKKEVHTMESFLNLDMKEKIIYNIILPPLDSEYKLVTFKIMPRAQSAHAIVNAGFLYKIDESTSNVKEARIVYGALSTNFNRAKVTETYLVGKKLFDNKTLQAALKVLDGELVVEENPPEPSAAYRKHLAKALFFKGLLIICPAELRGPRYESGVVKLHESRGLSSAKQTYSTDSTLWPLNQPSQKVEALHQCSGEARYVEDLPKMTDEVYGAFVLSTVANGNIVSIDATEALKMDGVLAFYTAKDIPGLNSFTPSDSAFFAANEEILADGTVKYYYQPIGIIVAETKEIANRATNYVTAKYSNVTTPIVDILTAKEDISRNTLFYSSDATNIGTDVAKVITGQNVFYGQYHCPMETMVAIAKPTEEGLEVSSATQWIEGVQIMVSRALSIPQNKIDVSIRHVGGSYGLKISRNIQSAIAASLVCQKLNRPCRFILPITTNMKAYGKRMPAINEYEVAVNSSGVIQYINNTKYGDNGYKVNETLTALGIDVYNNCYDITKFNYKAYDTVTDTPKNTWCRSPGTLESIAACEYVMERISYELSLDPLSVRLANLDTVNFSEMLEAIEELKANAEYVTRRAAVDTFNTQNRWTKRGLRFALARWAPAGALRFGVNLAVYRPDGSIIITHGGIEMGQGINTKAVQLAAYFLKVPMDIIQIKAVDTTNSPNAFISGGSLTTQHVLLGLKRCCEQLLIKLEPIKATMTNPTWAELITAAYNNDIDLETHAYTNNLDIQSYEIYGVALSEVEVDCLTGEYEILRVDLLQDVGLSINPNIDIGQVEGGFIMALGYWTCEKLEYDTSTGKILTDRTWDYHLPEARDIPKVFNVYLKKKSYSNEAILGSKAVGEPSACAAVGITFAIREAITMARQESGIPTTEWFSIDGPFSTEAVCMATKTNPKDFKFH